MTPWLIVSYQSVYWENAYAVHWHWRMCAWCPYEWKRWWRINVGLTGGLEAPLRIAGRAARSVGAIIIADNNPQKEMNNLGSSARIKVHLEVKKR
jgi:hypothetical protein